MTIRLSHRQPSRAKATTNPKTRHRHTDRKAKKTKTCSPARGRKTELFASRLTITAGSYQHGSAANVISEHHERLSHVYQDCDTMSDPHWWGRTELQILVA
ncbi:hypothetical protein N7528_007837 [Penicillium herquei]|nr:hypothetical protein N7528_007837 [Penicillium herquei]